MSIEESVHTRGDKLDTSVVPRGTFAQFIADQRLSAAKRKMKHELSQITSLVDAHKSSDLPAGHIYYKMLLQRAKAAISSYQTKVGELGFAMPTYHDIAVGVPSIKEMEEMADSETVQVGVVKQVLVATPVVVGVLAVAGTLVFTFCQAMHYYLIHWIVR